MTLYPSSSSSLPALSLRERELSGAVVKPRARERELSGAVVEPRVRLRKEKAGHTRYGLKMSQRLDPCRFADIFARFDGVFERIGQSRILLGFHYHPAFIAKVVQQLEHRTEIDHPVARDGEGAFFTPSRNDRPSRRTGRSPAGGRPSDGRG